MESPLIFKQIAWFGCLLICFLQSSILVGFGGDKREEKRWYTKQLRTFMWTVDDTLSRRLSGQDYQQNRQSLEKLGGIISERLVLTRKAEFEKLFQDFLRHLAAPQDSRENNSDDSFSATEFYDSFQNLRNAIYRFYQVRTMPSQNPNQDLGERLYMRHCAQCHGAKGRGDGVLTENPNFPMDPKPTDFVQLNQLGVRNAFSYFNTMIVGLDDSAMRSFKNTLTSHELWSLAFYLLAGDMRPVENTWELRQEDFEKLKLNLDLQFLAAQSDRDFLKWLEENEHSPSHVVLDWIRNGASFGNAIPRKI